MVDVFSEQHFRTPTGGRRQVCGVPVDGSSIEDETETATSTLTS